MENKSKTLAILSMLASSFCVTLVCVIGKTMSESFSLPLLVFIRFFFPLIMISWIVFVTEASSTFTLRWTNLRPHMTRALFVFVGQYAIFYYLMDHTALDGTSLLATAPLHMFWLRSILDGKPLNKTSLGLLALGFLGAMLMLKPDAETVSDTSAIFGLLAGFTNACSQRVLHKSAKDGASPLLISFFLYGFASLFALIPLLLSHHSFTFHAQFQYLWDSDLLVIFILFSVLSINNQVFKAKAYRLTPSLTLLAPITYSTIIFSAGFDRFFYHIYPDPYSCIGALLIAFSGIYMIRHQMQDQEAEETERNLLQTA